MSSDVQSACMGACMRACMGACKGACMGACMRAYVRLPEGHYVEKLKYSQLIILTKINCPPLCLLVFSKDITSY